MPIVRRPRMDVVARVLWRTATAASVLEVDRSRAAREWFDDLALGRIVLPAHVIVPEDGGAVAASRASWRPDAPASLAAGPVQLETIAEHELAGVLARPIERRGRGVVVRERARWVHPALRTAAVDVAGPPFVHGWINLAAFVVPGSRSAFGGETRSAGDRFASHPSGAVDWVGLRAAVLRAVSLFDGLLEVHAARGRAPDADLAWRRIGIGIAGLGRALASIGMEPGSSAAALTARKLALCIDDHAHRASIELGAHRGVFPRFGDTVWSTKALPRRHGLCTSSWSSAGLLAASGLGEGLVDLEDSGQIPPALLDQVRVQVECQRAFEGVVEIELAIGANHDVRVFQRIADERDVQCVRCVQPLASLNGSGRDDALASDELRPRPRTAAASSARSSSQPSNPATRERAPAGADAFDTSSPSLGRQIGESRSGDHQVPENDVYSIAPALRIEARTERGRWHLDVVFDEYGENEVELVLVSGPPGPDGWRLVDGLNAALRNGSSNLRDALGHCADATPGASDLVNVLRRFAERHREPAR